MSITEVIQQARGAQANSSRHGYRRRGSAPNLKIVCDAAPPPLPAMPPMSLWKTSIPQNTVPSHLPQWLAQAVHQPGRANRVYDILNLREDHRRMLASHDGPSAFRMVEGRQTVNMARSRYFDIVPYDATRVKLPQRTDENEFVNASWVTEPDLGVGSSQSQRRWIASQGPLSETLHDFFSLFLDLDDASRPNVIIQVTACFEGNRCKSAPYVPQNVGETQRFEAMLPPTDRRKARWTLSDDMAPVDVTLQHVASGPRDVWRESTLAISQPGGSDSRTIKHFECTAWADHGVPESVGSILDMIRTAEAVSGGRPIVVHCSAGVGRTGTLIAVASLMRQMRGLKRAGGAGQVQTQQDLGPLPDELRGDAVAVTVDALRDQRVAMVQTPEQLHFVYQAVAHLWDSS